MKKDMAEKNQLFDKQSVDHEAVIQRLVKESSPRRTFLAMILISSMIATLGLLNESVAIVIGAMLVAPLLWPILGFSMGFVVADWRMIKLALISIGFSMIVAIVIAILITLFYVPLGSELEIIRESRYGFMGLVALGAGAAAAFAVCYEHIKEAVAGVAISVALLPPLVGIGIGLGGSDWSIMQHSASIFLINLGGVIIISLFIFILLGFHRHRKAAEQAVKKEEKVLKS